MTLQMDRWPEGQGYHNIPAFSLKSGGITILVLNLEEVHSTRLTVSKILLYV